MPRALSECTIKTAVSKIKVAESGKKAIFCNDNREDILKIQVDGCLKENEIAADWIISKEKVGDVIVELKGRDVEHAALQVMSTAEFWVENKHGQGRIAGLIVSSQYPKFSTQIQKLQNRFSKIFKGPLHVCEKCEDLKIENVLSFKGPHRS